MNSTISILDFLEQANIKSDREHPILITSFISLQHIHFAAELELINSLNQAGFSVLLVRCSSGLGRCFANPEGLISRCRACKSTNRNIYRHIESPLLTHIDIEEVLARSTDLGNALTAPIQDALDSGAYSSTIAFTKDPIISLIHHREMYENNLKNALDLYKGLADLIRHQKCAAAITFNGRFYESRATLEAAYQNDIPSFCHESSGSGSSFRIFKGGQTHSLSFHKDWIQYLVEKVVLSEDDLITAQNFFHKQKSGIPQGFINKRTFVNKKHQNLLPDDFDTKGNNISIFISSEDEMAGFSDWACPFGATQFDVIKEIIPRLLKLNLTIWIRLHPHLKGRINNSQIIQMSSLTQHGVHVIGPEAPVDSYALINNSSNVISFGSTIGLEATYMGVNTILLGHSIYEHLDINRVPSSLSDMESLLNLSVSSRSKELCLVVAHYLLMEFNEFNFCKIDKNTRFLYFGKKKIAPTLLSRVIFKMTSRA